VHRCSVLLRATGGEPAGETCMAVSTPQAALMQLLNESRAFGAAELAALPPGAASAAGSASAEEAVEQLLYEAQEVVALPQPRRRAAELPRAYSFSGVQSTAPPPPLPPPLSPPPPLPPAAPAAPPPAAVRSLFGWAAGWQATASAVTCIVALLLLGACLAFGLGARKARAVRCVLGACVRASSALRASTGGCSDRR
jgi:hypothetical protein